MKHEKLISEQRECFFPREWCPNAGQHIVAMTADGGNHFLEQGIVEGATLFFDRETKPLLGCISCFKKNSSVDGPPYKLSSVPIKGYEHFGRLVLIITKCEV